MKDLAAKLIQQKRDKAAAMVGKAMEVQISTKALTIDEEKKTVDFVMSTETIDRHGDIIDQESWILTHFEKNPIAFLQHESYKFPIGQWSNVHTEADPDNEGFKRLVGTLHFAIDDDGWLGEDVERAWRHVKRGDMRMTSVGFIPHRAEYNEMRDAFVLFDSELLECSLVGIGSNRFALVKEGDEDAALAALKLGKDLLDAEIERSDTEKVIPQLRARSLLKKAIRQVTEART